jgi:hypothetical protein
VPVWELISDGVNSESFSYIDIRVGYIGIVTDIGWMIVLISLIISAISVSIVVVSSSATGTIAVIIIATQSIGAGI